MAEYSQADWSKVDPEERSLFHRAEQKSVCGLSKDINSLLLLNGPAGYLLGAAAAGVTPTWDKQDLSVYLKSGDGWKRWMPGYVPYRQMKLLGVLSDLKAKARAIAAARKRNN